MPFRPEDMTGGGLAFAEGGRGAVAAFRFTTKPPPNYSTPRGDEPIFALIAIQPLTDEDEPDGDLEVQWYPAGKARNAVPCMSGETEEVEFGTDVVVKSSTANLSKGSKFSILQKSFFEAGLKKDDPGITEDTSELEGRVFEWGRIPTPERWGSLKADRVASGTRRSRRGEDKEEEKREDAGIIVATKEYVDSADDEFIMDAEEAYEYALNQRNDDGGKTAASGDGKSRKSGDSGSRKSRGAKDKKESRSSRGSASKPSAGRSRKSAKEEKDESFDVDQIAADTLLEVVDEEGGSIRKTALRRLAAKTMKGGDLSTAQQKEVIAKLSDSDEIEAICEANDLNFEDGKISSEGGEE